MGQMVATLDNAGLDSKNCMYVFLVLKATALLLK